MAVYVTGLVLLTAAVELVIAFFIAVRSVSVPSSSSDFWSAYFGVIVVLVIAAGVMVPRGLRTLRSSVRVAEAEPPS